MTKRHQNFLGIDESPFTPEQQGEIPLVGVFYSGKRMDGVLTGRATRDGTDGTDRLCEMIEEGRFNPRVLLMGGIAVCGFNVVDIAAVHARTGCAVLVVARREPHMDAIRAALLHKVPGGAEKLRLIEKAGPMEPAGEVWVQRAGLTIAEAALVLEDTTLHGKYPEPLRVAHMFAAALASGRLPPG